MQLVGGERIIDRVARGLRAVSDRLLVISNDPRAAAWLPDAEVAADVLSGRASLIGIHAALAFARGTVIVVAWDMPFVPTALLAALRHRLRGKATAVIPIGPSGPEAVCAAYAVSALPVLERLVGAGALKLSDGIDALPNVDRMSPADVAHFGDPGRMFFNVNRPDDLRRAEAIARAL